MRFTYHHTHTPGLTNVHTWYSPTGIRLRSRTQLRTTTTRPGPWDTPPVALGNAVVRHTPTPILLLPDFPDSYASTVMESYRQTSNPVRGPHLVGLV